MTMPVSWSIIRQLARHPRRVCISDDQRTWKAYELLAASFHIATAIESHSARTHVGVMLPPSGLFPSTALATWMLGRTLVPLNYLLKGSDLQYVADNAQIDTVITVGPMLDFLPEIPHGPKYLLLDQMSFKGLPQPRWPRWPNLEDLCVLLYTSGTSGRPKGVMLTHRNIAEQVDQLTERVPFRPERDKVLGVLPQFHVFGLTALTIFPLVIGVPIVYTARFVPRRLFKLIHEERPTAVLAIASMFGALLTVKDARPEDVQSLYFLVSGGEPLPDPVFQAWRDRFHKTVSEGYGMTETSAVTHWSSPEHHRRHSVGQSLPRLITKIVDLNDGHPCGPGEDGEIRVSGPNIMKGYFNLPEETARAFDDEGFLCTGDIGHLDSDGFLFITGRLKEMMIIGGENVFPREIEEVLNAHPDVLASGVIGVKDASRGETPVAFVELHEGIELDQTALRAHCRKLLAQYKVPRDIIVLSNLPRNPTGKIMRRELRTFLPDRNESDLRPGEVPAGSRSDRPEC